MFLAAMAINVVGGAYLVALKDIAQAKHSVTTDDAADLGFN